ncbi:hypothetical protein M1B72_07280 [Geomonas paludis]|uniref:Uncharacterized protein n=1 Tax=Geomonas paludis TaxID=2740185 RepID=A0ABY4LL44_9BACT|nr:hypothetical protein [Geomonas paludis]UPU37498.1 hypothetical protein M1B72_07280 [Geomonas paludis]
MEAERRLEQAQAQLASARAQLVYATGALYACEASGSYDDEGDFQPPDCSREEGAVGAAEAAVAEAEESVAEAEAAFEATKEHRMKMEQRNELAQRCLAMASQLSEAVQIECGARLSKAQSHLVTGTARLSHAQKALNAYVDTNPSAAQFHSWLNWSPQPNTPVTPKELRDRLNLSVEQQRYFYQYLADRDPDFRAKIAGYRRELDAASSLADRQAVQLKVRRNLSGYCAEELVRHALGPLGTRVDTQARTVFDDGRFTKTDLVVEGLKVPVILGRGEGMGAPVGGSVAVEVKCGQAGYVYGQRRHMIFQSGGHKRFDASMTLCSRDIKATAQERQGELRDPLREAGSPLVAMLPTKEEFDAACWAVITGEETTY